MPIVNRQKHKRILKALTTGFVAGKYPVHKQNVTISAHLRNNRIFLFAYKEYSTNIHILRVMGLREWLKWEESLEADKFSKCL